MDVYCTLLTRRQIRVCFEFFMTPSWSPKQLLWYYSLCKVWLFTLLLPFVCHFNNRQCLFYMCTLKCDTQHKGASIYKLGFQACAPFSKKISLASHLDELHRLVFSYHQFANLITDNVLVMILVLQSVIYITRVLQFTSSLF